MLTLFALLLALAAAQEPTTCRFDTAALAFGAKRSRVSDTLTADDYADDRYRRWVETVQGRLGTPFERYTGLAFSDLVLPEGGVAVIVRTALPW